jgi:hypothetical protein
VIQVYAKDILVMGVTRTNVDRLTAGQPIKVAVVEHKRVKTILLVFGETKSDILAGLEKAGMEIPQAMKDSAAADPI